MTHPNVYGVLLADHQGLCLGGKGKVSTDSAGIIGAIAEQAGKLEPHNRPPLITLESDSRSCHIQRSGTITCAIYKNNA